MRLPLLACLMLAGCETVPVAVPPADLSAPTPALMVPPKHLPDIPKGAGLPEVVKDDIQCRRAYGRETDKLRLLQEYSSTLTRKISP